MMEKKPGTRVPIYRDAAFAMGDPVRMKKAFATELDHPRAPEDYIYSRYRNPTVVAVEEQLMGLEGCEWALLTQSGMAAIDLALSLFQKGKATGPWLFFSEIYGGTNSYIERVLKLRRGLEIEHFAPDGGRYDLAKLEKMLVELKPELLYFEAISNPMLIVAECEAIIAMAKKAGVAVVMDNTFATPLLCRPLELGADLVVHSATKYLAGHNDVTAGVVCGNDPELVKQGIEYRKLTGHMLAAEEAYALDTQLKTFSLRVKAQNENAARLAEMLDQDERVEKVLYPGLPTHPTHKEAVKLFGKKGFGAVVTFDLKGATPVARGEAARRFLTAVEDTIPLVPTLGDVNTLLLHIESVWGDKYPMPGMFRMSIGIEEFDHLETTIQKGLSQSRFQAK